MKRIIVLFSVLALAGLNAQESNDTASPPPAVQPPNCDGEQHHQFDFWIGEWAVYSGENLAGRNTITPQYDGCSLHENWRGQSGSNGQSFNAYDRGYDKWHQTWVDNSGTLLELNGGLIDGSMVLSGVRPRQDGTGDARHRITWTPNEDGTVRQHWEASRDGENWTTLFDGLYKKDSD